MNRIFIQVPASPRQTYNEPGVTLTLAGTGLFLGILLSTCGLATIFIRIVSKMNELTSSLNAVQQQLQIFSKTAVEVRDIDKRLDLHLQDYSNRNGTVSMLLDQLNEKVENKFERVSTSVQQVERYLQNSSSFTVRGPGS